MIDSAHMKVFLMKEYQNTGGKNPKDFLQGMVWMESLMLDQMDKEERMNDFIPCNEQLKFLEEQQSRLMEKIKEITKENECLKNIIQENKKMSKTQRAKILKDAEIKKWKDNYEYLMTRYLNLKGNQVDMKI